MVFFGYTHCPDVCPATVGIVNQALATTGDGPRAVFVSIDPERDDAAAMKQYLRYLPKAYVGLSGTPGDVRRNADAWGVKYARIETDSANGYAMAHTADIFLVDAQGRLRAHFPFGTKAEPIAAALQGLVAEAPVGSPGPRHPGPRHPDPDGHPRPGPHRRTGQGHGDRRPRADDGHGHLRTLRTRRRWPPSAGRLQQRLVRRRQPRHPDHHRCHGRRPRRVRPHPRPSRRHRRDPGEPGQP